MQHRGCGCSPAPPRSSLLRHSSACTVTCLGREGPCRAPAPRVPPAGHPSCCWHSPNASGGLGRAEPGAGTPRGMAMLLLQQESHKFRQGSSSSRCYFQKATTLKHLLHAELLCQAQEASVQAAGAHWLAAKQVGSLWDKTEASPLELSVSILLERSRTPNLPLSVPKAVNPQRYPQSHQIAQGMFSLGHSSPAS